MGRTFAQGFLAAHIIRPKDLIILEKDETTAQKLRDEDFETVYSEPGEYIRTADLVILAVKPQNTSALYPTIAPFIKKDKVIVSIMAGVKLKTIAEALGVPKVVRAMPNLPAKVGMGMTAFSATDEVTRNELIEVQNLLTTTGRTIYLDKEDMVDAATAISGSGPAYVYYFMQAMIDAAMKLGFNESQAELLVWQTFVGSMHLHNKNALTCDEWISRVASKGGTTEAAINTFSRMEVQNGIKAGLQAAFDRAEELGAKK